MTRETRLRRTTLNYFESVRNGNYEEVRDLIDGGQEVDVVDDTVRYLNSIECNGESIKLYTPFLSQSVALLSMCPVRFHI